MQQERERERKNYATRERQKKGNIIFLPLFSTPGMMSGNAREKQEEKNPWTSDRDGTNGRQREETGRRKLSEEN